MILTVHYDKVTGVITASSDEESVVVQANEDETINDSNVLSLEIAIDLSAYQELFNDEILEDGDNNE